MVLREHAEGVGAHIGKKAGSDAVVTDLYLSPSSTRTLLLNVYMSEVQQRQPSQKDVIKHRNG